jgi:predicted protein tyrosine phosphatase
MKTQSKDKIEKADRLFAIIQMRLQLEKEEAELKDYFKAEITDGLLEAGDIVMTLETKTRTSLDKKSLEAEMGAEFVKQFEKVSEYQQLNVKSRAA